MVIVVLGYPGPFFNWGVTAIKSLIEPYGETQHSHVDLHDLSDALDDGTDLRIVSCNFPDPGVLNELIERACPVIILKDAPINCLMCATDSTLTEALEELRAISSSIALNEEFVKLTSAIIIDRSQAHHSDDILTLLKKSISDSTGLKNSTELNEKWPIDTYSPSHDEVKSTLRSDAVNFILGGKDGVYHWEHDLFMIGEVNVPAFEPWIDLTGPARTLYYGPYFHLPPGHYNFKIAMQFNTDAVALPLTLEIVNHDIIGIGKIKAEEAGRFSVSLDANVINPKEPLEIRIKSDEGAIFGNFGLLYVHAKRNTSYNNSEV